MKDWLREVEVFALESAAILGPTIQETLVRQSAQMLRYPVRRVPGGGRVYTLAKRERRRTGMAVYTEGLPRLLGYGRHEIDDGD